MLLAKAPLPEPSVVFVDKATVGFAVVLQQTPRTVMAAPPSSVILPPLAAVTFVMEVTAVVVRVGNAATTFGVLISFWQLKDIIVNRIKQRKVFMYAFVYAINIII